MKKLTIVYGDTTLFDAEVSELTWVDSASGVKVEGRTRPAGKGGGLGVLEALGSGLASAQKAKTQKIVEEKTADD